MGRVRAAIVVAVLGAGCAVAVGATATSAQAVASGCTSARPTKLTGGLFSYPHGYSVDAAVGITFADSAKRRVGPDGLAPTSSGYGYLQWVNPDLPAYGDPHKGGTRSWGPVCVASNVKYASLEVYPSIRTGTVTRVTTRTYFGGAADEFDVIPSVGATVSIDMRVPEDVTTSTPATYVNATGYVDGYVKCGSGCGRNSGTLIPASALSPVRAFPFLGGSACGVQGFSASADQLGASRNPAAGDFYRINALAGGQCGASAQPYSIRITCVSYCSPTGASITKIVTGNVSTGRGTLLDVTF